MFRAIPRADQSWAVEQALFFILFYYYFFFAFFRRAERESRTTGGAQNPFAHDSRLRTAKQPIKRFQHLLNQMFQFWLWAEFRLPKKPWPGLNAYFSFLEILADLRCFYQISKKTWLIPKPFSTDLTKKGNDSI